MDEANNIDYFDASFEISNQRSPLVDEMINSRTSFIERWAIQIFLAIFTILIFLTWVIKYPDIVIAKAILLAENAPKELITHESGRLSELFAKNNDVVKSGDIIAWIESVGNPKTVNNLSKEVEECINLIHQKDIDGTSLLFTTQYNDLGELQGAFQQFILAKQSFADYRGNGYFNKKMLYLKNDLANIDGMRNNLDSEKSLVELDFQLAEETYNMKKTLLDEKAVSRDEFRIEKSKYVNKKMAVTQLNAAIFANMTQRQDKLKEIDQLQHDIDKQVIIFGESANYLKSALDIWKKRFFVTVPIDGKVTFSRHLEKNQTLQTGEVLGYVNPEDGHFYAEMYLPQSNFGKIDTGLAVQLRFDAYPFQEVGFVRGKIAFVSNIPNDSGFLTSVDLTNGLITNSGNHIKFRDKLSATAIVITKNMRLFQRFYYNIIKATTMSKQSN